MRARLNMALFFSRTGQSVSIVRIVLSLTCLSAVSLGLIGACRSQPNPVPLASLRRSGEAAFICVDANGNGLPMSDCPQGERTANEGLTVGIPGNQLISLVTQTVSAEVAVIRPTGANANGFSNGRVLDADRSNPGVTPLRVGQNPVDIVSTPGGLASFVGVGEVGREGIFALPTSCIFEPGVKSNGEPEAIRDLTTWPACSLPSLPGAMQIMVDPFNQDDEGRVSCDSPYLEELPAPIQDRDECLVDLGQEKGTKGRLKLLVALPDLGELAVIDAQELLNRDQGTYEPCAIERVLSLQNEVAGAVVQALPEDLVSPACSGWDAVQTYDLAGTSTSRPAGMAQRDSLLMVADRGAPLIHVIEAQSACDLVELEPLYATSLNEPERIVTTSRVAISPTTPAGKKYVYAVDEIGENSSSVIVYDASPGSASRTPLVRPGSVEMPLEPADRIAFAAPVKDVQFALFDTPYVDPLTRQGVVGERCDPDPSIASGDPRARYRPTQDRESGAAPGVLRGLFGYALLGNGNLSVIDIDDFDAACRRPTRLNSNPLEDFRGCADDVSGIAYYTLDESEDGLPTVSNEVSCRVVDPHRARSGTFLDNELRTGAPSLNGYPRLNFDGRELPVSRKTSEGRKRPIMLGVDFDANGPVNPELAEVFVGQQLRKRFDIDNPLVVNPNIAEQASTVLPYNQPRAYPPIEQVTVTYEGSLDGLHLSGILEANAEDAARFVLTDQQALFCDGGVQDRELTAEVGVGRVNLSGDAGNRFSERHSDYVHIVSEVLDEDDPYWNLADEPAATAGQARTCGNALTEIGQERSSLYSFCDQFFADGEIETDSPARDLRIIKAYQNRLEVELRQPERFDATRRPLYPELLNCCFPNTLSYRVRGGDQWIVQGEVTGFRNSITAIENEQTGEFECKRDCSPSVAGQQGRVFEVSSTSCTEPELDDFSTCSVGLRQDTDVVCAYDSARGPLEPEAFASECIFNDLTRRFAIYRGLETTQRGMAFSFEVTGGFQSQGLPLTGISVGGTSVVLPVSLVHIPTFNAMGVVDSQDRGLIMVDLLEAEVAGTFF